jgi:hypothetical protein
MPETDPAHKLMCVRIPVGLHAALVAHAEDHDRSASSVVRLAVRRLLAES